jgi:hypothetical protein
MPATTRGWPNMRGTAAVILKQVKSLGYATSVHRMRDYVEMHAVPLKEPGQLVLARDGTATTTRRATAPRVRWRRRWESTCGTADDQSQ